MVRHLDGTFIWRNGHTCLCVPHFFLQHRLCRSLFLRHCSDPAAQVKICFSSAHIVADPVLLYHAKFRSCRTSKSDAWSICMQTSTAHRTLTTGCRENTRVGTSPLSNNECVALATCNSAHLCVTLSTLTRLFEIFQWSARSAQLCHWLQARSWRHYRLDRACTGNSFHGVPVTLCTVNFLARSTQGTPDIVHAGRVGVICWHCSLTNGPLSLAMMRAFAAVSCCHSKQSRDAHVRSISIPLISC